MSGSKSQELQTTVDLLIVDFDRNVFIVDACVGRLSVPRAAVPTGSRTAAFLSDWIKDAYSVRSVQLATLPAESCSAHPLSIHELISNQDNYGRNQVTAPLAALDNLRFPPERTSEVRKTLEGATNDLGRFSVPGWLDRLLDSAHIAASQVVSIRHVNHGTNFCLLDMELTSEDKLWFKAVGHPNEREYELTVHLSTRCPNHLPQLVAALPDWKGWFSRHVAGTQLDSDSRPESILRSLDALADVQRSTVGDTALLLGLGAHDWRVEQLLAEVPAFFACARMIAAAQQATHVPRLSISDLNSIQTEIVIALQRFGDLGLPDTIVHGDVGHGNVIIGDGQVVFLDWAESGVGSPLLTAELLLADLERSKSIQPHEKIRLRNYFASLWDVDLSRSPLSGLSTSLPIATAWMYCLSIWHTSRHLPDPCSAWPAIRSMLRRIQHECRPSEESAA